jgi:signal transduction histidine kinase
MKIIKNPITTYTLFGGLMGFFILHPISMTITETKHMFSFNSFMWHDLLTPMGYYFTLIGLSIGFVSGFFQNRIHKKNLTLAKQKRNIEQIATEKDTLLRILSHDLTNHIGCANALLKAVLDDGNTGISQTDKEDLNVVYNSLAQAQELIDFTRTLIAIESGKMEIRLIETDLTKLIEESIPLFKQKCLDKNILFVYTPLHPSPIIAVEPIVLKNCVVNNILNNAIKFSMPEKTLSIALKNNNSQCIIEISNIGPYLPEEKMKTLFSPSAKTSTLGTNNERGTGFGLPLAYRFIKMMHGDIKASCKEDPGEDNTYTTTFSIVLPKP